MNTLLHEPMFRKDRVLIDTWWNVNSENIISVGVIDLVLIDTWWNVNLKGEHPAYLSEGVLIDTWWNVNFIKNQCMFVYAEF